ncbi:MAG: YihY/virulence factor BrkB family protein, partial [Chloroflexota bacterium]
MKKKTGYILNIRKLSHQGYEKLRSIYQRANKRTGGVLGITRDAFQRFAKARGAEVSASLAYYALFSIFPLILAFIAVGSYFLQREVVQTQLLNAITTIIPNSEEVINLNISRVFELRGSVGIFAAVTLIWSATSVFNILALNINLAFPAADLPNFLRRRLIALFLILALAGLFILSLATSALSEVIPVINIQINGSALHETFIWQIISLSVPVGAKFLLFWGIYMWVPTVRVRKRAALIGGLVAAVAWELVTNGFTWYLSSGFANYQVVYGSFGAIVAFMFWIYLTGTIALFGAY